MDPEFDLLLRRAIELVDAARPMPLSASSMINKEEVLELLQSCLNRLPEEMRAARWLLKEREDFLKRVHRKGTRSWWPPEHRRRPWCSARRWSRRPSSGPGGWWKRPRAPPADCDWKPRTIATPSWEVFENALERILNTVKEARTRLQGDPLADLVRAYGPEPDPEPDDGFFDQDTVG